MQAVKRAALPLRVLKKAMQGLQGVIIRASIACLPLVAIVLLCLVVFSGFLRGRGAEQLAVKSAVSPPVYADTPVEPEMEAGTRRPRVKAAFERLHITHATIRVPQ